MPLNTALKMLTKSWIAGPISAQNQLPGNKGTGTKSDATANSEKKTNMISPFMFISTRIRLMREQMNHNKRCCLFV
jgi:hypothetical protein